MEVIPNFNSIYIEKGLRITFTLSSNDMSLKTSIIISTLYVMLNIIILPSVAMEVLSYDEAYSDLRETLSSAPQDVIKKGNIILAKHSTTYSTYQLINIYGVMLHSHLYTNNYTAAFAFIDKIKALVKEDSTPISQWKSYYLQAVVYIHIEQGNKAIELFLKAYKLIKPHSKYSYERELTENGLGYIYVQFGFYKEAIPYLSDSSKFNKDFNKPIALSRSYNNLGEAYFGLKNYAKSIELHKKALAIRLENQLTFYSSYSFHNLGLIYKAQLEYKKAEENLLKAIKIRKDSNFIKGFLSSQIELAKLYIETGQIDAGSELLLKIITAAKTEKKFTTLSKAYKLQAELYQSKNQFEAAFHALKNYQTTLEKIQLNINDAELSSYVTKLSTVTKDLNILSLSKANEINELKIKSIAQRSNLIITFSLIIVATLSLFLWILHQKRKKIQKINHSLSVTLNDLQVTQKKLIESEKMSALTVLVTGVAHKINTPLGIGITAISHLEHCITKFSALLEEGQVKKSNFTSFVHELEKGSTLAQSNMKNVAELVNHFKLLSTQLVDNKKERFNILKLLSQQAEASLSNIRESYTITKKPVITVHGDKVFLMGYPSALKKAIEHLINNSMDHAFTAEKNSTIDISVSVDEEQEYVEIIYQDNGKGIAKDLVTKIFNPFYTSKLGGRNVGLGLSVVYNLIVQLMQGNIICDVSQDHTTSFIITLPVNLSDN
jgi:signal transduction histidine kinase